MDSFEECEERYESAASYAGFWPAGREGWNEGPASEEEKRGSGVSCLCGREGSVRVDLALILDCTWGE